MMGTYHSFGMFSVNFQAPEEAITLVPGKTDAQHAAASLGKYVEWTWAVISTWQEGRDGS